MTTYTHGEARRGANTPEYRAFHEMKKRCLNPNHKDWGIYGGRGVAICGEWTGENGYVLFLAHVGRKPDAKYSLDRIDTNKGYEPGNVRWADAKTQANNRRWAWLVSISGEWINAKTAAPLLSIPYSSLVNAMRGVQKFPRGFVVPEYRRAEGY